MLFLAPDACSTAMEQARHAMEGQQFREAARFYERAASVCASRDAAIVLFAQAQLLSGESHAAEKTLRRAVNENGRNAEAFYALGRMLYDQSRYAESAPFLLRTVGIDAGHYRAHDYLGLCYDALHQDALATKHFFRALELVKDAHRDYDWAFANLAEFYLKRGEFEKAFQLAAEAATRTPSRARNFLITGRSLVRLGRDENSLRWLGEAIRLDPNLAEAQFLLGQALKRLGRADEAAPHLTRFRELQASGSPSHP